MNIILIKTDLLLLVTDQINLLQVITQQQAKPKTEELILNWLGSNLQMNNDYKPEEVNSE